MNKYRILENSNQTKYSIQQLKPTITSYLLYIISLFNYDLEYEWKIIETNIPSVITARNRIKTILQKERDDDLSTWKVL